MTTTRQTVALTAAATAAASAGLLVLRLQKPAADRAAIRPATTNANRWRSVTVLLPAEQVLPDGRRPAPLADLGDLVEMRVQPAPADRGTD